MMRSQHSRSWRACKSQYRQRPCCEDWGVVGKISCYSIIVEKERVLNAAPQER